MEAELMIDRNRQRFRQLPEYDEQMTRLKEEYPQVCKIANRYSLLIFLTDLILFVASFIALNFLFMVAPDSKDKFVTTVMFALVLSIAVGNMVNPYLLDMKDEAIDKYVYNAHQTNHPE
jgi:hypothetical protein